MTETTATSQRISPYWRSLDDLENSTEFQEFLHREFPQQASEIPDGVSRRRWLQLMGASFALAGVQGCRWQTEKIVPFAERPDGYVPGASTKFATSVEWAGAPKHLLVTCYDGRPIKVEGNPEHPGSRGSTDHFAQAATLSLYDPDRQSTVVRRDRSRPASVQKFGADWAEFEAFVAETTKRLAGAGGAGLGVLMAPTSSLAITAAVAKLARQMPQARFYQYAPVSRDNELAGAELAFGKRLRTHYKLAGAKVIAAFDDDLLHARPDSVAIARDYAAGRDVDAEGFKPEDMSRVYVAESQFSVTGSVADHRLAVRSSDIAGVLAELRSLVASGSVAAPPRDEGATAPSREEFLAAVAEDLLAANGASVVTVGAHQPAEAHAIAHEINALLGNAGNTVDYTDEPSLGVESGTIVDLVGDMAGRRIDTLVMLGGNPVYDAPADLAFAEELAKVPHSVHLSTYDDETSRQCEWSLPETHPFESWGDASAWDGTVSVGQPLIEPLLGGRSALEVLALLNGDGDAEPQALVREAVEVAVGALDEAGWKQQLHDGFAPDTAARSAGAPTVQASVQPPAAANAEGLEIVFRPSASTYDGRFANNGWLQETPEFITKLTWDNAAVMSPATAKSLGTGQDGLIQLKAGDREMELPVFVVPGTAEGSVGVALGYGRTAAGRVGGYTPDGKGPGKIKDVVVGERGNWGQYLQVWPLAVNANPVGHDSYAVRTTQAMTIVTGASATSLGRKYQLATTQNHFSIDELGLEEIDRRAGDLVREGTIEQYRDHNDFAQHVGHHVPDVELWNELSFADNRAWGMAIDLNKCIGCNACVVACQAENNIPVVGKDQVARGREMHWIRIDRYFHGDRDAPQVAYQPVACQQCETAPCEQVCPVAATVHSDEGLNDMSYNRCIGTRYCANNCPFKVRRFNFFSYTNRFRQANNELMRLVNNPEVTVRSRGVMEKCTYCTQRIAAARIKSKTDGRPNRGVVEDGEIVTACQQACPTQAITFGDLNDPKSRAAKLHASPRSYGMLDGLRLKPRTQFLARIRNPHPRLAKYYPTPGHADHGGGHGGGQGGGHGGEHGGHENHEDHEAPHSA